MTSEETVSVDRDFARFGRKSYAINKINSVEVRDRRPHGQGAMFVFGLLALICVLSVFGQLGDDGLSSSAIFTTLFAGAFGFLAYRSWLKSQVIEYQLFLMVSSSEAQAISSLDRNLIDDLRDRIERAMAGTLSA